MSATDGGSPALSADVDVELDVVDRNNQPPVWDQNHYGPVYVEENAVMGTDVISVRARFVHLIWLVPCLLTFGRGLLVGCSEWPLVGYGLFSRSGWIPLQFNLNLQIHFTFNGPSLTFDYLCLNKLKFSGGPSYLNLEFHVTSKV